MGSVSQALKTVKSAVQKAVQATSAAAQRVINGVGSVVLSAGSIVAKTATNVSAAVLTGAKTLGTAATKTFNAVASVVKSTGGAVTGYVTGLLTPKSTISLQSSSPQVLTARPTVDYYSQPSAAPTNQTFYSSGSGQQSSAGTGMATIPNDPLFDQGSGGVSISGEQGVDGGILGSNSTVGQASNGLLYGLAAGALLLGFT